LTESYCRIERQFRIMGGPASIVIDDASLRSDGHEALFNSLHSRLNELESRYSRFQADSLINLINLRAGSGVPTEVDTETATLLNFAAELWLASEGLFDITSGALRKAWDFRRGGVASPARLAECLPKIGWDLVEYENDAIHLPLEGMEIDLGGIVKEYAVDCVAALIRKAGATSALVELAGDVAAVGNQANGQPWRVSIRDPDGGDALLTLSLCDTAAATSGNYARTINHAGRRLSHFLDPYTGWPVDGPISVTTLDRQCLTAGAIATVACLKPDSKAQHWLEDAGLPWLMMKSCGNLSGPLLRAASHL